MNDSLSNLKDEQLDYLFDNDNADLRIIRACGEKGADFGITCLTRAAENGRLDLVKYLVEEKKVLEFTRYEEDRHRDYSDNGTEPLIEAAQHGYQEIVQYLLEKYPSLKDIQDDDNTLPLHHAARYAYFERRHWRRGSTPFDASPKTYEECLRLLSSNWDTAYVNAESDKGTPLCLAADNGTLPAIRLLLAHGADVNGGKYTSDGTPVLQGNDEEETIMALMDRKDVDWTATNEKGETLFHNFKPESAKLVDFYLKKLKALTSKEAQLRSCEGTTLLHALVNAIGNEDLDIKSKEKLRKMIPGLIEKGIDVNALSWADGWRNNCSGTAAHCAARNNDLETLEILKENGADLTAVDCQGNTLFLAAADSSRYRDSIADMKDVFDFLSKEKVDIAQANDQGQNVLFNLCEPEKREAFDYVLELAKQTKATEIEMLNQADKNGKNLLWYAVEARNLPLAEFLVEKGLTVDAEKVGDSFVCNVMRPKLREKKPTDRYQFLKKNYTKLGCRLDLSNKRNLTVLEWAISQFNDNAYDFEGIKMLIEDLKADCTQLNEDGEGLFHWLASASAFDSDLADYLYNKNSMTLTTPNSSYGQLPIHLAAKKGNLEFIKWALTKDNTKTPYNFLFKSENNLGQNVFEAFFSKCRDGISTPQMVIQGIKYFGRIAHANQCPLFSVCQSPEVNEDSILCYMEKAGADASCQVIEFLAKWLNDEKELLNKECENNAIEAEELDSSEINDLDYPEINYVPSKCTPACIQAYLDACSQYGLINHLNWKKLFDSALEKGNSDLAMFIAKRKNVILQNSSVYDIVTKCLYAKDGNLDFFIMLFDELCWPRQLLVQDNGTSPSILTMLLTPESYSDDKLPLLKYFWNKFPEKPISYNELLLLLEANTNEKIKTIEWMESLLQKEGYSLPETSSLTYSLFAKSNNVSLINKWLQKRNLEGLTISEICLNEKESLLSAACSNSSCNAIARLLMGEYGCIPDDGCLGKAKGNPILLYLLLTYMEKTRKCPKRKIDSLMKKFFAEDGNKTHVISSINHVMMARPMRRRTNPSWILMLMEVFHATLTEDIVDRIDKDSGLYSIAKRHLQKRNCKSANESL